MTNALTILSHVFYLISNALLIPVMLGLLFGFLSALFIFGQMIRELLERHFFEKTRKECVQLLESSETLPEGLVDGGVLTDALGKIKIHADNNFIVDKIIASTESYWDRELEKLQTWCRLGPSLGLMGTLIPLGPGLVALADGDLKTLSNNLIIAFATTVVGILIALIVSGVHSVRKNWYRNDSILLNFAAEILTEKQKQPKENQKGNQQ